MNKIVFFIFCLIGVLTNAQNYTSTIIGDTSNVDSISDGGYLLSGGGANNDDAMNWFLDRANGGDVVVILTETSQFDYNDYLYNQLNYSVNSVETLIIPSAYAANKNYVKYKLKTAEAIYIVGNNATSFYDKWKFTHVDTILNKNTTTNPVLGGFSAGMTLLGDYDYYPEGNPITSLDALNNPYHANLDSIYRNGIINKNFFVNYLFESNFNESDNGGRLVTLIARAMVDYISKVKSIAVDYYTAVAIDKEKNTIVFGNPTQEDFAYFIEGSCPLTWINYLPETIEQDTTLTWDHQNQILKVLRVPGNHFGNGNFNFTDLNNANIANADWFYWYVIDGELIKTATNFPTCFDALSIDNENDKPDFKIINNNTLAFYENFIKANVYALNGQRVLTYNNKDIIKVDNLPTNIYIVEYVKKNNEVKAFKWFIK